MSIRVEQIQKRFGDFTALSDINLDVQEGQLVGLLGPSASGSVNCWSWSSLVIWRAATRPNYPAGRNSAWPWPGHWP